MRWRTKNDKYQVCAGESFVGGDGNHDDADHQSSTCVCQSDFEEQFIIQLSSRAARKDLLNLNSTITGVGTGPLHARIDSF